ncbi:putative beta-fructofuranosidase [Helianthus annuus]|uniref:Beta-fructofuranosidase n=1 Tax=Helianthus annuus TaxID=4232 RepID=A0A251U5N5_HELAN|nr:putative beta-fructofuranosidase [Helianthus annuus]KAJ0901777.1 putative beta-fructofuranosidase [Helianthus annuus]
MKHTDRKTVTQNSDGFHKILNVNLFQKKSTGDNKSFPRAVWLDGSGRQLIQWPVEEI